MADNNDVASFFGFAGAASALVFSCEWSGQGDGRCRARSRGRGGESETTLLVLLAPQDKRKLLALRQ